MKYTPQLLPRIDHIGNTRQVGIQYDNENKVYVGSLRLGTPRRMVSGKMIAPISAIGEGDTPNAAADATIENFKLRQTRGQSPAVNFMKWNLEA